MPQHSNESTESKVGEAALEYEKVHRWPVFPCNPLDKRPLTKHGFKDATIDPKIIRQWWKQWPNAMIGVPMGSATGVFCVDLDRKEGGSDGVNSWAELEIKNGAALATRRHITPSTGQHLIFKWQEGIRNIPLNKLAPGIEIKGEGGYIVVPPSKMHSGKEYIGNNTDVAEAPEWLIEMIQGYLKEDFEETLKRDAGRGTSQADFDNFMGFGPIDPDEVREALSVIPSDDYEIWFRVAGAIRKELGDSGRGLFEEWSRKSKKFELKDCLIKWKEAVNITSISAGTIFRLAEEYRPGWWANFRKQQREQEKEKSTDPNADPNALVLTDEEFVARYKAPSYVITGLLQKRFVYSLTGMTGSGKTCIALRIAAHVTQGLELNGRKVKQGKVLYFAGENPDDVLVRWIKLCEDMKISHTKSMMHWLPGVPPLKNAEIRKRIYAAAQKYGPFSMVIVDTSAAYFQGDDENSNVQLGEHARLMRRFVNLPGSPIVLVTCHPTKHPDLTNLLPRGGGAFLNEMDGNLSCVKDNLLIEIDTHGKFRGPEFAPLSFKLHPCKLNELNDEDGNAIWSVIAIPITDAEHADIENAAEQRREELIQKMFLRPGISIAELADELNWTYADGRPNKSLIQRIMNKLILDRIVEKKGGHYTLTKKAADRLRAQSGTTKPNEGLL